MTLLTKFQTMADELETELIGRGDEIQRLIIAVLARQHLFSLSEPGAGKTYLATRFALRIGDARRFKLLATRFTTDADLFGIPDITALKAGRKARVLDGMLPTAHIGQLEEIFKCSPSALNALLEIMERDREFWDDGRTQQAPLWSVICSSNEMPEAAGEQLAALYDRILLRQVVPGWRDSKELRSILDLPAPNPSPTPVMTASDVEDAQAEVAAVAVPDDVMEAVVKIADTLRAKHSIVLSARRVNESLTLVQAAAWLDGQTKAAVEHAEILSHCFWVQPEQITDVAKVVAEVAVPMAKELIEIDETLGKIVDLIDTASALDGDDPDRAIRSQEVNRDLTRAADAIAAIEGSVTGRGRTRLDDVARRVQTLSDEAATKLFGLDTMGDRMKAARQKVGS